MFREPSRIPAKTRIKWKFSGRSRAFSGPSSEIIWSNCVHPLTVKFHTWMSCQLILFKYKHLTSGMPKLPCASVQRTRSSRRRGTLYVAANRFDAPKKERSKLSISKKKNELAPDFSFVFVPLSFSIVGLA